MRRLQRLARVRRRGQRRLRRRQRLHRLTDADANKVLASATAPAASTCGTRPCWKLTGPASARNGVLYNDPLRASEGVKLVKGKGHDAGKAQVLFKALGDGIPALDLAGIAYPVTVQVRTSDAACWEQQFGPSDEKKNDGATFKALHLTP